MPMKPVDTAIKVILGPCIDDTDFKTREEALTYDQAGMEIDVILEKADGTITTTAVTPTTGGDYDWTHTDQGYYELELPASGGASYNNDEEGILTVVGYCTGVLPFRSVAYDIVPTKVYNSIVDGSDNLEVDVVAISGDSTAADNLELALENGTAGYVASDLKYIDGTDATGVSTSGKLHVLDDEGNTVANEAKQDTAQADLDIITGTNGVLIDDDAITSAKYDESTAFPIKADDSGNTYIARTGADGDTLETLSDQIDAIPTAGENADAVWDAALADHTDADSMGEAQNRLDDIQDDTEDIQAKIGTPQDIGGEGATLADNLDAMAGITAGSAAFDRLTDSQEAISDRIGDPDDTALGVSITDMLDNIAAITAGAAAYDRTTDSLEAIRDRGDDAWVYFSSGYKKGVAVNDFHFVMSDAADPTEPYPNLTDSDFTKTYSVDDWNTWNALSGTIYEIDGPSGVYAIPLSPEEMNNDTITLRFSASGAEQRFVTIKTAESS